MSFGDGFTVLVVDDDAALRMLCRVNLELDGYQVLEAGSLDEAVAQLEGGVPDVVILDVRLGNGGESGLGLLERVDAGDRPGVIVLTGSADLRDLEGTGVDAVISKPFALDELIRTVHTLAAARSGS